MSHASDTERVEIPVTRYIERAFVISKMKRWLAAAIAVGLMLSAAYCLYFNMKYTDAFQNVTYDERLLVSNYNGDYLAYPETIRCAVWDIRVKEDVMADLSRDPEFVYKTYLHQYGDILVERLNSLWSSQAMYEEIRDDPVIAASGLSPYEWNDAFGGAFLYSEQTLGINVTAPLAYQETLGLSNEEMVATRDRVFAAYTALLDDAACYDDLPIELYRKSSRMEDHLSEMKLVREVLQAEAPAPGGLQFPKKRMLFCAVLGMALVEMIAFLLAVRDDRVKSVKELRHRTDLVMIDVTSEAEMDACCQEADHQASGGGRGCAYLYRGAMSAELTEKMLTYIRTRFALKDVAVLAPGAGDLPQAAEGEGVRLIVPVTLMKTTYGELAEIAEELSPCSAEVQAVVLQG